MDPAGYPENMVWILTSELLVDEAVLTYLNTSAKRPMALFTLPVEDQAIPGARTNLMPVAECIVALYSMLVHFRTENAHAMVPKAVNFGMYSIHAAFCFVDRIDDQKLVFVLSQFL
jgi:hypothetical protein